jgi:hypothetical protein
MALAFGQTLGDFLAFGDTAPEVEGQQQRRQKARDQRPGTGQDARGKAGRRHCATA